MNVKHVIRWIAVLSDGTRITRKAWHTDSSFGWDAVCSCGWQTRTGGAIAACIRREIKDHKTYGWIDFLTPEQLGAYARGEITLEQLETQVSA